MLKSTILCFLIFYKSVNSQLSGDATNINPDNCGLRPIYAPSKIVGGSQALPGDFGWQVAMKYNNAFTCGASVLNSQWVISAAHCVYGRATPALFSFDIGLHDRNSPYIY